MSNYDFFMQADVNSFLGEWIAVCDNKIVTHGNDVKQVYEDAKSKCLTQKFLLARVPNKETMIL
jgi:hypothetical protein